MSDHAACTRCGGNKPDFDVICPSCGHLPQGEGLLIAWLLSEHHLTRANLDKAAARVRHGEPIRASDRMLDAARRALGSHYTSDPGLARSQIIGLALTGLLLTPLPGLTLWAWWRQERPRAAWQAGVVSAPWVLVYFVAVIYVQQTS